MRFSLFGVMAGWLVLVCGARAEETLTLAHGEWKVAISASSGAVTAMSNATDPTGMNWVHPQRLWGVLRCVGGAGLTVFDHPKSVTLLEGRGSEATYDAGGLKLVVDRKIDDDGWFAETYTLTNTSTATCSFPEESTCITVPFNDSYQAGAPACLNGNCNAHLWAGGASSWANAVRMSGSGPHLGLVLTKGSLGAYSILDGASSNDRGNLAFNPESFTLKPGESWTLAWRMFWHKDWSDFWADLEKQPGFVRLRADHYSEVQGGGDITVSVKATKTLSDAMFIINGRSGQAIREGNTLSALVHTDTPGEKMVDLQYGGQHAWIRVNVLPKPSDLVRARVAFIIAHQQRNAPGNPLDGAYLAYDNDTGKQVLDSYSDHNEGRERIGMGVLIARYLPECDDAKLKKEMLASVERYERFVRGQLQDANGVVYNNAGYSHGIRPYNYPWVAEFHLAMYLATREPKYLDWYVQTERAFYSVGADYQFYPIGTPIREGLETLKAAHRDAEYAELLKDFEAHAMVLAHLGSNYPKSEVNYEQSIVAPGIQILLETYEVTKKPEYLEAAKKQMPLLEAFAGEQPDYRLYHLPIRHWDDYWFGKLRLYGDTFPHYWDTINATVFQEYSEATQQPAYAGMAQDVLMGTMNLFTRQGAASCAYVYPLSASGSPGQRYDPWANDQDWALVHWLAYAHSLRPAH